MIRASNLQETKTRGRPLKGESSKASGGKTKRRLDVEDELPAVTPGLNLETRLRHKRRTDDNLVPVPIAFRQSVHTEEAKAMSLRKRSSGESSSDDHSRSDDRSDDDEHQSLSSNPEMQVSVREIDSPSEILHPRVPIHDLDPQELLDGNIQNQMVGAAEEIQLRLRLDLEQARTEAATNRALAAEQTVARLQAEARYTAMLGMNVNAPVQATAVASPNNTPTTAVNVAPLDRNVLLQQSIHMLSPHFTAIEMHRWIDLTCSRPSNVGISQQIHPNALTNLNITVPAWCTANSNVARGILSSVNAVATDYKRWAESDRPDLIRVLKAMYPLPQHADTDQSAELLARDTPLVWDKPPSFDLTEHTLDSLRAIHEKLNPVDWPKVREALLANISGNGSNKHCVWEKAVHNALIPAQNHCPDIQTFKIAWTEAVMHQRALLKERIDEGFLLNDKWKKSSFAIKAVGKFYPPSEPQAGQTWRTMLEKWKPTSTTTTTTTGHTKKHTSTPSDSNTSRASCRACGSQTHSVENCFYHSGRWSHPNQNRSNLPWKESDMGRLYISKGYRMLDPKVIFTPGGDRDTTSTSNTPSTGMTRPYKGKPPIKRYLNSILNDDSINDFVDMTLLQVTPIPTVTTVIEGENIGDLNQGSSRGQNAKSVRVLLDTGALGSGGNYIRRDVLASFAAQAHANTQPCNLACVCSGVDGTCMNTLGSVRCVLSYHTTPFVTNKRLIIDTHVLPNSPIDIIIGRTSIKQYNLADRFRNHFYDSKAMNHLKQTTTTRFNPPILDHTNILGRSRAPIRRYSQELATLDQSTRSESSTASELLNVVVPKSALLDHIDDGSEELDLEQLDAFAPWLQADSDIDLSRVVSSTPTNIVDHDILDDITYEGSTELRKRIRDTCEKFRSIFSKVVPPTPARLQPFDIIVDKKQWEDQQNRKPPRVQTYAIEAEIRNQVAQLKRQGIIVDSNAMYYSQVHMVRKKADPAKPNSTPEYRMCIDYRSLNDCCQLPRFPLPYIAQMHQRLGQTRATIYGVSDFTSGYHQAPVSKQTQRYTAFITSDGIYEFTRVPFGPKGAPAYFQERMALEVLHTHLYKICEVYLDDVIIYARSENEFITNLNTIFSLFRDKGLTLKPNKCRFGMAEVEYVGRVISSKGLTMSKNKIRCVLDFPKPEYMQQLKSFIGLVNYFSPFIQHHATIMHPLNQMVTGYGKRRRLIWTPAGESAWARVRETIENCPTLEFANNHDPLYLETDASDYGIGGYLYQLSDGQQKVIAFVSKSLTNTQLKWSTYQKEGYGIYYSLKKLATFLRDRKFTLRTDHANLTYLNKDPNPVVTRWRLDVQQYDFDIEYLPGPENKVADALSRQCRHVDTPKLLLTAVGMTMRADDPPPIIPPQGDEHLGEADNTQEKIIKRFHNSVVGHHGVERTVGKILQWHKAWPYMRQHVAKIVRECPCCQKMSQLRIPIIAHRFTTNEFLWPDGMS
jgi:hypothetical protein